MKNMLILKYGTIILLVFIIISLNVLEIFWLPYETKAEIQLPRDLLIAAIIQIFLDFKISTTTLSLEPALVSESGEFNIASSTEIILSLGTNNDKGWDIQIKSLNGGLFSNAANYILSSSQPMAELSAGVEGYGVNATSVLPGVIIGANYNNYGTNIVGELRSDYRTLASFNNRNITTDVVKLQIKASASITTPAASDYQDVIIITVQPKV